MIGSEDKEKAEEKRLDYEMLALANNEKTSSALLEHLRSSTETESGEENIEWVTPQSEEDLQEILSQFSELS